VKNTAFYFNFKKEHENQLKNQTAYTPAVSLIVGLQEVLKMMKAEGLEGVFGRQAMLAKAMREGIQGAGLACFRKSRPAMPSRRFQRRKAWTDRLFTRICVSNTVLQRPVGKTI
jgi:Serine-pyruvate aminotransferase/archaeal aspartate aminotransferase